MVGARHRGRTAAVFLLPALALLALFVLWPLARAIGWSLTNTDLLAPGQSEVVGGDNYRDLLQDPRFRRAFFNTAWFAVMVVPLQTALALVLALWVNRPERAWRWLRTAFFLPVVVAMPVLAVIWTLLYQPAEGLHIGPFNAFLGWWGVPPQAWLREARWALPAIAFMSIWQGVGLQMMVFLAGLQQVPRELLEAAKLDGAGAWQRLVHVILPALRNTLVFVITVTTILAFRIFVQPYLMTRGGPGESTRSLVQYIYETTFLSQDLGRACAAAVLFLLLVGALTWAQRRFFREERS